MKRSLVPLILSLFVAGAAYAQGTATAPAPTPPARVAPAVGAGSAAQPTGSAAPGSDQGSAATPGAGSAAGSAAAEGSAAAGSAAAGSAAAGSAAAGSVAAGSAAGSAAGKPAGIAWYDKLANEPIQENGTFWLPKSVNAAATGTDFMFYSVLGLSLFFFVAIAGVVVFFTIKYRHRPGHKAQPSPAHNDALEITWTVIPTIICVFLFWYGWQDYVKAVTPPQKAVEIQVLAWQWNWQFTHENGVTDSDLHVPVNTPVRLVMTSKDVIHSFYVPVMRIKQDVVPRRYTYAWFEATKPGTYRLTCAEYCGTNHAQMGCLKVDPETGACLRRAVVVVHAPGDYERYLADKEAEQNNLPPVELGKRLYEKKGCIACHTVDGSARVGPSWKQPDWGKMIPMADGSKVKMDESYVRESILSPQAKSRPGYPPSMPSFEGQLKPKELAGLIAYIKSLKQ